MQLPFAREPISSDREDANLFDDHLNAKEDRLRNNRVLRDALSEVSARLSNNPGECGLLWTGPGCTRVSSHMRYPRIAEDLDQLLDEASALDEAYYHPIRAALALFLHGVFQAAVRHEEALERRLLRHSAFRPVAVSEVEAHLKHVRTLFGRARHAGIERFRNFVKNLKWVDVSPGRVRRGSLTRNQGLVMRCWFCAHFENPYPTTEEKEALTQQTGLTIPQVNNWFINARVRHWNPCIATLEVSAKARQMADDLARDRKRRAKLFGRGDRAGPSSMSTQTRNLLER